MRKTIGVLAVLALLIGMLAMPAAASGPPDHAGGPPDDKGNPQDGCPDGLDEVAKYERKLTGDIEEDSEPFEYVAEHGGDIVTIVDGDEAWVKWSSTTPIDAVVLFGGTNNELYEYDPAATEGEVNNTGMENKGEQTPDISNIRFCAGEPNTPPPGNGGENGGENGNGNGEENGENGNVDDVTEPEEPVVAGTVTETPVELDEPETATQRVEEPEDEEILLPTAVEAGSGGELPVTGMPLWLYALMAAGLALLGFGALQAAPKR